MKSKTRIIVDSTMSMICNAEMEAFEDLQDEGIVKSLQYDHDYADFQAQNLSEIVHQAMRKSSSMANLFFMRSIDDVTFEALKASVEASVPDGEYRESPDLDRTFLAMALFLRSHPAHAAFFDKSGTDKKIVAIG
ncbi:hypothetical protein [Tardiphaga sp.]|jgi:hypothetical protein|uniref:hypothetical protein n=1 Tax=Tardiphaga sp. TaxID=1926292 RepID=UPI0037DA4F9B